MGNGEIWVCAASLEASRHIKKVFDEANFLNCVRVVDTAAKEESQLANQGNRPALVLVDLGCPRAWEIISLVHSNFDGKTPLIALVDGSTEPLLDRAYDAGVQTYLRSPLTFADFLQRARMLNLEFRIQQRAGENG